MILVFSHSPIQGSQFGCSLDSTGGGLLDVDVDDAVVADVLFCVEGDGGEGDGFAGPPADALEG